MAYKVEDEVDWSDGTLDDSLPSSVDAPGDSGYVSPIIGYEDDELDYLFGPQEHDEFDIPPGTALPSATHRPTSTRAQRASLGVGLNRQPSNQDYANFALYQANQKAYEATFLKQFVNHALHPAQIEECFRNDADACSSVQKYITAVSANINGITKKMIWNAHCRAVNLFGNTGREGAPFWDIGQFNQDIFQDFVPDNTTPVSHKMEESWHRTAPQPVMVRYTTRQYPLGHHSSPFEEIDDVSATLFGDEAFGKSLPTGRSVKPPSARKGKRQALTGARARDPAPNVHRGNWLASLIPPATIQERDPSPLEDRFPKTLAEDNSVVTEPKILNDLRLFQKEDSTEDASGQVAPVEASQPDIGASTNGLTRLEQLFEEFGNDALNGQHRDIDTSSKNDKIEQVPTWPIRLLNDHKWRLTQRSPQVLQRALPGIRAVIAEALLQGYRPTDPDFEELIADIETREQAEVVSELVAGEAVPNVQHTVQVVSRKQNESKHGKKRKRDQPGIRMFNKPVEPSKKRRKMDATNLSLEVPSQSKKETTDIRKQKTGLASASSSEPRRFEPRSAKQKASQHKGTPLMDPTPLPPHPSGSTTLELHQQLPPTAYLTPKNPSEKPVWRCGIKHAMGHYYNAGDRKNCPGCFTALSDNINAKVMDFYLPSRTHFHQPNPASRWRPSKPFGRVRRSKSLSHNSIAKEAYWSAVAAGSTEAAALRIAIDAVTEHLKPKPRKDPTPEPTPAPEPDPGPHPSGSATMEHGQDLPDCAYFSKRERHEQFAWRCDVNHALGQYYLAGDKRTCPGCGSNKNGAGKHMEMDFFMPAGVVVRQEVETLKWKPRKPYKAREGKPKDPEKSVTPSHNQIASRKYREAVAAGKEHVEALKSAIEETDKQLDEKEADALQRNEDRAQAKSKMTSAENSSARTRRGRKRLPSQHQLATTDPVTVAVYPASHSKHTYHHAPSDEEPDNADDFATDRDSEAASPTGVATYSSSDDETSYGSDSE